VEVVAQQHCSTPETFPVQTQDAAIYPPYFETNHPKQSLTFLTYETND